MDQLQPQALNIIGDNTYRVRFATQQGEVEYTFSVEEDEFLYVVSDDEFLEITSGDPAADVLKQAIANFHQARCFEYAREEASKPADIRTSLADTDASKRASA